MRIDMDKPIDLHTYKKWSHDQWVKKQNDFHKIAERDCYGYKKAKQNRARRTDEHL